MKTYLKEVPQKIQREYEKDPEGFFKKVKRRPSIIKRIFYTLFPR